MNASNNYSSDLFGEVDVLRPVLSPLDLAPVVFPTWTKRRLARPTWFSRIPRGTNIATAVYGAGLLGQTLMPQGEEIAALLCARRPGGGPLYNQAVILEPRRSSKTLATWAELIGDAAATPGRRVLVTAQDGTRIREILRDEIMELLYLQGFERKGRGRLLLSNGSERIEFANRSLIRAVPPKPGVFRSKPADRVFIDEGGEISAALSRSLMAAIMPLFDTRPDAQLIVSGTPGGLDDDGQPVVAREGVLWDKFQASLATLGKTSRGATHIGVLAYALRDGEELAGIDDNGNRWVNKQILRRIHPGIGTLTTYPTIASRFLDGDLGVIQFESEYGCRFPLAAGDSAIPPAAWAACTGGPDLPERPAKVGIGYDVEPDGSSAALLAAWRDDNQVAHLEVIDCRPGTDWLPGQVKRALTKHRCPAAYDSIGANLDVAQVLTRLKASGDPIQLRYMQAATARLVREITTRNLRHYEQPDLDNAVAGAAWRNVGDSGRLFGRKASAAPVSAIVAAAAALWSYDQRARFEGNRRATSSVALGQRREGTPT